MVMNNLYKIMVWFVYAHLVLFGILLPPFGLLLWLMYYSNRNRRKSEFVEYESHSDPPYEETKKGNACVRQDSGIPPG
jgi:hypothetical protein